MDMLLFAIDSTLLKDGGASGKAFDRAFQHLFSVIPPAVDKLGKACIRDVFAFGGFGSDAAVLEDLSDTGSIMGLLAGLKAKKQAGLLERPSC